MDKVQHYIAWMREYLKDYILENTGLKVLALLITAVLWLSVASRPVAQVTLRNVPILFPNLPDAPNLEVTETDVPSAQVYLEGPRDIVDSIRPNEVTVYADMRGVEPGVRVKQLAIDTSRLPSSVKGIVDPREIRVTVERVIEKEVKVKPRVEGKPPDGYEIIATQVNPAFIRIGGAESRVREINEVSTETVRLSTHTEPFSEAVAIDIGSTNVNITSQSPRQVMLSVVITEKRTERVLTNVPVAVLNAPAGARALPSTVTVTVFGPQSLIQAISQADVNVSVDYRNDSIGRQNFQLKATIAANYADKIVVRNLEPTTVHVRF